MPPARGPDPAPSGIDVTAAGLRKEGRTPRCGLHSEGQPRRPSVRDRGWPVTAADIPNLGQNEALVVHPARRTLPPAPGPAATPADLQPEAQPSSSVQPQGSPPRLPPSFQPNEHPRCGLRPEGQLRAGPIPASHRLPLGNVQPDLPPKGRTRPPCSLPPEGSHRQGSPPASRKNASPAAASGLKRASRRPRHPTHGTAVGRPPARRKNAPPPCSLQPKGANAQTPIWLRPGASLDRLQDRAASSGVASSVKPSLSPEAQTDSAVPFDWNAIRYGNGKDRTNRVGSPLILKPPTSRARTGRAASQIAPSVPAGPTSRAPSGRDRHPHRCLVWQKRHWASGLGYGPERLAGFEGDGRETLVGASGQDAWAGPPNRVRLPLPPKSGLPPGGPCQHPGWTSIPVAPSEPDGQGRRTG